MNGAETELLGFFGNVHPLVLGAELGSMVLQIAISTKMGLLSEAVELSLVGGDLGAVVTQRML